MRSLFLTLAVLAVVAAGSSAWHSSGTRTGKHFSADLTKGMMLGLLALLLLVCSPLPRTVHVGAQDTPQDTTQDTPQDTPQDSATGDGSSGFDLLETGIEFGIGVVTGLMTEPQPALNIPRLDPFQITNEALDCCKDVDIASVSGNVLNVNVTGLSSLAVRTVKVYLARKEARVDVFLPQFSLNAAVEINAGSQISPLNLPFSGGFVASVKADSEVSLSIRLKLKTSEGKLQIDSLKIVPNIDSTTVNIGHTGTTGFFVENPHLDDLINILIPKLQKRVLKKAVPLGVTLGTDVANKLLVKLQSPPEA